MQSDSAKLFVGGISWDTNEERLKDYFSLFGEVVEAVIMKDRATGRARGFGFIVFADPAVADRVIQDKHNIDGRMVEAKKAVPRDDQNVIVRNNGSIHGSPGRSHTRKIFVGGLASTVTETDFKNYFDQFGTITDVVVMYDHNTLRPRGFGFITYDSEEAVESVLLKSFHELNGKLVEVKRAVPKELLPSPSRSPVGGYNHGVNRVGSFLDGYIQGYSPNLVGGYGLGRDGRHTQLGQSVLSPNGHGYDLGINFEPGLRPGYSSSANFDSNFSYGRGLSPYNIGNSNRSVSPLRYDSVDEGNTSFFSSAAQNLWGSGGHNFETNSTSSNPHNGIRSRNNGGGNTYINSAVNWGSSAIPAEYLGTNVSNASGNLGYGVASNINVLEGGGYRRNTPINAPPSSSYAASNRDFTRVLDGFYNSGSFSNDTPWISSNSERGGSVSFGYGLQNSTSDISAGYVDDFTVSKSHSKEESLPRMIGFDITT